MKIGDKIRYLRRKENINQAELARRLGVSTSTVGFWEIGRRVPDIELLVKLSEIFNVSTDYLLNLCDDNTVVICEKEGVQKKVAVSEEQIKSVEDFLDSLKK